MEEVSRVWGRQVGQTFGIVKIKDVRNKDYLKEVCKYVVDGSELAKWPREHILEFAVAVRKRRFFFSFGTLRELAPTIRAEIAAEKEPPPVCDCGCSNFIFQDSLAEEVAAICRATQSHARPRARAEARESSQSSDTNDRAQLQFSQ